MFSIPIVKYRCTNWKQKKQDFLALLNEQTLTMGEESVYSDYGEYDTLTAEHEMGLYDTPNFSIVYVNYSRKKWSGSHMTSMLIHK